MDKDLLTTVAEMCCFAQEHVQDPDAWDHKQLETYMQCTDYQVSCFLAQNTKSGNEGVECGLVINQLCELPPKSTEEWKKIIDELVGELGGWVKKEDYEVVVARRETKYKSIRVRAVDRDCAEFMAEEMLAQDYEWAEVEVKPGECEVEAIDCIRVVDNG